MKEFIPHEMLSKAQFYKYKFLSIPAVIIVISFFLRDIHSAAKYLSLLALALYFFIFIIFRFKRNFSLPEINEVLSPINGRIIDIETVENGSIIMIKKPFFASAEIVTCTSADKINTLDMQQTQISWRISNRFAKIFHESDVNYQAALIGLSPGSAICALFIPSKYEILVNTKNHLEAGETVVAIEEIKGENHQ